MGEMKQKGKASRDSWCRKAMWNPAIEAETCEETSVVQRQVELQGQLGQYYFAIVPVGFGVAGYLVIEEDVVDLAGGGEHAGQGGVGGVLGLENAEHGVGLVLKCLD